MVMGTFVQSFAHKAFNDQKHLLEMLGISTDFINDKLRKLAGLGSWGKYSQNCHAELMNFLGKPDCSEPFYHQAPPTILKPAPGQESVQTKAFPIFLPHRLGSMSCSWESIRALMTSSNSGKSCQTEATHD